jgi:hypothetical protein
MKSLIAGLSVLVLLIGAMPAAAQPVKAIDITNVTDGTYVLTIAGGAVTLRPLSLSVPNVTPGPGPQPPVPPALTRAQQIQAAAESATADPSRQETAATLAALYDMVNQQVKAGKATGQLTIAKALQACDSFALPKGAIAAAAWKPFQVKFASLWEAQVQTNVDDGELAKLIDETVTGLKAAAPNMSTQAPTIIVDGKEVPNPNLQAEGPNVGKLNWAEILKFFMTVIWPMILPLLSKASAALAVFA